MEQKSKSKCNCTECTCKKISKSTELGSIEMERRLSMLGFLILRNVTEYNPNMQVKLAETMSLLTSEEEEADYMKKLAAQVGNDCFMRITKVTMGDDNAIYNVMELLAPNVMEELELFMLLDQVKEDDETVKMIKEIKDRLSKIFLNIIGHTYAMKIVGSAINF